MKGYEYPDFQVRSYDGEKRFVSGFFISLIDIPTIRRKAFLKDCEQLDSAGPANPRLLPWNKCPSVKRKEIKKSMQDKSRGNDLFIFD